MRILRKQPIQLLQHDTSKFAFAGQMDSIVVTCCTCCSSCFSSCPGIVGKRVSWRSVVICCKGCFSCFSFMSTGFPHKRKEKLYVGLRGFLWPHDARRLHLRGWLEPCRGRLAGQPAGEEIGHRGSIIRHRGFLPKEWFVDYRQTTLLFLPLTYKGIA